MLKRLHFLFFFVLCCLFLSTLAELHSASNSMAETADAESSNDSHKGSSKQNLTTLATPLESAHDSLKKLWEKIQSFEENVIIASMDPKSGPIGVTTQVTITGIGFLTALAELSTYLKSENFQFVLSSTLPQTKHEVVDESIDENSIPNFFLHSIIYGDVNETKSTHNPLSFQTLPLNSKIIGSSLPLPTLVVHIDVLDGLYLTVIPEVTSDTLLKFSIPLEALDAPPIYEVQNELVKTKSARSSINNVESIISGKQTGDNDITGKTPTETDTISESNRVRLNELRRNSMQDQIRYNSLAEKQVHRLLHERNLTLSYNAIKLNGTNTISKQGQRLAMISLHFFPTPVLKEKRPQIFRIYPTPKITHIVPQNLSLSGNEAIYLFGSHLFASDTIKVRFSSQSSDKSKIQNCEFVMAAPPPVSSQSTRRRLLQNIETDKSEQPAIFCLSPEWTTDDKILVSLSFNGQQYHRASLPDLTPILVTYADASSLLGVVAKGVVEREKDAVIHEISDRVETMIQRENKGEVVENVNGKKDPGKKPDNMLLLKLVDETHSKGLPNLSDDYERLPEVSKPKDHTALAEDSIEPKHLPNYREKPKDLLSIHLEDAEENYYVLSRPSDLQKLRYDFRLIADISVMIAAAAIGGFLAESLSCPIVLGHLVGGILVGPQCLNRIQLLVPIMSIGQLNSAFLLFELGLHFSFKRVAKVRQAALWAGVVSHFFFLAIFVFFAFLQKTSFSEAFVLGCFVTMSSTAICSRDISSRLATETHEADVVIGILLIQDVLLGLILALLPAMMQNRNVSMIGLTSRILAPFFSILILAFVSVVVTILLLPRFLSHLYRRKSREVLLLCCLAGVLMMGLLAEHLQLSLELGAFAYGLMIACQPQFIRNEIESLIGSLKDFYGALFFASIGLVLDPIFVWDNLTEILSVLGMIIALKLITFQICLLISRYDCSTSTRVALMLSHIGEFGFVVLGKAAGIGVLGRKVYLLLLGTTGISLILTPILLKFVNLVPTGHNPSSQSLLSTLFYKIKFFLHRALACPFLLKLIHIAEFLTTTEYSALSKDDEQKDEANVSPTSPRRHYGHPVPAHLEMEIKSEDKIVNGHINLSIETRGGDSRDRRHLSSGDRSSQNAFERRFTDSIPIEMVRRTSTTEGGSSTNPFFSSNDSSDAQSPTIYTPMTKTP